MQFLRRALLLFLFILPAQHSLSIPPCLPLLLLNRNTVAKSCKSRLYYFRSGDRRFKFDRTLSCWPCLSDRLRNSCAAGTGFMEYRTILLAMRAKYYRLVDESELGSHPTIRWFEFSSILQREPD